MIKKQKLSRILIRFSGALTALALLPSCFINGTSRTPSSKDTYTLGDPVPRTESDAPITISKVLRSSVSPASSLDLVGDGSDAIGKYCTKSDDDSSSSSQVSSDCNCVFSYTKSDGNSESFETSPSYFENNLIRCPSTGIPSAISTVKVKLHVMSTDSYTDEKTFNLYGAGDALDLTAASSFAKVYRYQCQDIIRIGYYYDGTSMYDPIQSEDSRNALPLNFYTTNIGKTLAAYSGKVTGWSCPANPKAQQTSTDLNLYSISPDTSGSRRIYPASGSAFDRSTFYLAKQRSGVFNVPVNAYIAPQVITSSTGENETAPIGYGASPIVSSSGAETCPDSSVKIPSGYHWVKVWLFRMALPTRKYVYSSSLYQTGDIACHPGRFSQSPPAAPYNVPFTDCGDVTAPSLDNPDATQPVARFLMSLGMCVKPTLRTTQPTNASGTITYPLASGTDRWDPVGADPRFKCNVSGSAYNNNDQPLHLCSSTPGNYAYDDSPIVQDLDSAATPRFDYLFVVTPQTITTSQMSDASSSARAIYTPYRFMSGSDCDENNPDSPSTTTTCKSSRMLRNYGLKLHDVTTAGDPPADSPNRPGTFPVCALQPDT